MKKQKIFSTFLFLAIVFAFSSCQKSVAENNQALFQTAPTVSPILSPSQTPKPNLDSPIRNVDFRNFTYSGNSDYSETFNLKSGEKPYVPMKEDGIDLFKVEYSDLTSDEKEEAIITMSVQTGGSAMPNLIYIYTLKNNNPKLLWAFGTGDRAEGGLKKIYADNGTLIVELFGDNKFENDKWTFDYPSKFDGDCCPTAFTKIRFRWNGEKFIVQGKSELFDYDWKTKPKR